MGENSKKYQGKTRKFGQCGDVGTLSVNPFDTSHRAKIGAKSAKLRVDVLMSSHYSVVTSLETVQPPMFVCYTLDLPSNLSSVPQLQPGGC